MAFLREHPDERVLVHLARADHEPVRLPLAALGLGSVEQLVALAGDAVIGDGDAVVLPSTGPAAHAYRLG
jgi:alpha-glucosidase